MKTDEILIDTRHQIALSFDSIVKSVNYIKLETTDNNIIGKVSQLLFTDSLIIVVDAESAKKINVFNLKGKFKYQIGKRGKGPGEYVDISNVTIEPQKNLLSILDKMQNRVIYYDMNGIYKYSERTQFILDYFEYLENGFKAYYKYGMEELKLGIYKNKPLFVTDSRNKVIYGDCNDPYEPNRFEFTMNKPLRKFDDKVYYSPNFSNMIYQVTDSKIVPKYHIKIAYNGMPPINKRTTGRMFEEYRTRYYIFNGDFIEMKDLSYINIMIPTGYPFVIYSHAKKKTYFVKDQGTHPLFPFLRFEAPLARYKDNTVVFGITSDRFIINKKELYKLKTNKKLIDDLYNGITENSNPVLIFCHLNKDI